MADDVRGAVKVLVEDTSGPTPRLLVGGSFRSINGLPITQLASWDGGTWSALGGGIPEASWAPINAAGGQAHVEAIAVRHEGNVRRVFVGGRFDLVGSSTVSHNFAEWVCSSGPEIFVDGFESGNTDAWTSAQVP